MSAPWNCTPGQLKVPELKEELRKRGITPKGLKKDLVEKLEEVLRIEGQGHFGNMLSCSSSPPVQISYNSPLLAADSRSLRYDSPPQAADPRGPCYNSPLPIMDSESSHHNSPLQVTDPKSPSHNLPHQVSDPSHNFLQVSGRKNAEVEVHDLEWKSAVANAQSSSVSAKIEDNCQKWGNREQLSLGAKNPFGVAHGFESLYYDSKKGAAHPNDPAMELCDEYEFVSIDTTNRVHWSGVDGREPEASRFAVGDPESEGRHDKVDTCLGKAVDRDKKSILSAIDPNLLEKHGSLIISVMEDPMEFKGMHDPYSSSNPLSHGFESDSRVNLEQSEAHVTRNREEGDHSRGMSMQESEEQEDKGSALAFFSGVFKLSETSQHLAENTCSKIISVCEKHLEHGDNQNRHISLNPSFHELESKTRSNPEQSEAVCLKQNMVERECAMGTGQQKSIEQEIDGDGVYEVSGSGLNFAMEQKFRMKSVSEWAVESEDMHKQYTSLNPTSYEFESESRVNSEELEAAHLKQNREDCNAPMGANKREFENPEDKGNALLFHSDKSDKLSEVNTNLVEKQDGRLMSPGADPKEPEDMLNKYINPNLSSHELGSEHRPNTEELEASQLNQHREEYNCPMGTNDKKFEEHEDKGSALSKTNLILDERQKFQEMAVSKEQTEAHDVQNRHFSLNSISHEYESKPGESEAVDHKQNREEYNHPIGTGDQEFEECKGKGDDLRFRSNEVPRLSETNPNPALKSNCQKEPGDPDNVLNQYIILNSISRDFESESRVNPEGSKVGKLEMNRRKHDHPMAMDKQE